MSGRDLARRQASLPLQRQARVGGEVSMRSDELVIRLRPTSVTEWEPPGREAQTVVTRPIPQSLGVRPTASCQPACWVFDRQAVTALMWFALVTTFLVTVWLVVG